MKAGVQSKYGPPDVLWPREVGKPGPGDGEVMVRVGVTTVDRTHCGSLRGKP
jgi:hypothetical protein